MQIDRASLDRLLSLNDRQLQKFILKLAADSGIDPAAFKIDVGDVKSIRDALRGASDADLAMIGEMYEKNKRK